MIKRSYPGSFPEGSNSNKNKRHSSISAIQGGRRFQPVPEGTGHGPRADNETRPQSCWKSKQGFPRPRPAFCSAHCMWRGAGRGRGGSFKTKEAAK